MTAKERAIEHLRNLRAAAHLVEQVRRQLNATAHECPTCGLKKNENWDEAQVATQLEAITRKLTTLGEQLVRKATDKETT